MTIISKVTINRFRSILNLCIKIDNMSNLVAICGENNVGKTNTLRAINLFFNPNNYDITLDRPTIKHAQGGASIDSKITIEFYNDKDNHYYSISRDFKQYEYLQNEGLTGEKYKKSLTGKTTNSKTIKKLEKKELTDFLSEIEFRYIESININVPEIVEQLTDDIIDVEYEGTRMTESKKALREAYTTYTKGLQNILNVFSQNISGIFNDFKPNWNISFSVTKSIDTFRDLISDDVELLIDDKGCTSVEQKGSGLQRLAVILLHFEILKRLKKKSSVIICVDEPDIYLHEGLQRKLIDFFKESSSSFQIVYTTHSKIFINQYSMKNVVLLESKIYEQFSARKKRKINVAETILVNLSHNDGYKKICDHLGIEKNTYDILDEYNILVEGGCDKKYIEELSKYFGIKTPKIITLNGVDNCENILRFYDSYYHNNLSNYKPSVKILFDNDVAGRKVKDKVEKNVDKGAYQHIGVQTVLICNFNGEKPDLGATNHEIEDFIYPEILCYLINQALLKMKLNIINSDTFVTNIGKKSFSSSGALSLLEHEKNEENPEDGNKISFVSSSKTTSKFKNSISEMFNISGEIRLIEYMAECANKYPQVKQFLHDLMNFE